MCIAAAGDPESFSRVDLGLPDEQLLRSFPLFPVSHSQRLVLVLIGTACSTLSRNTPGRCWLAQRAARGRLVGLDLQTVWRCRWLSCRSPKHRAAAPPALVAGLLQRKNRCAC